MGGRPSTVSVSGVSLQWIRSTGPAVVALVAALAAAIGGTLAPGAGAAASGGGVGHTSPVLALAGQSYWVTPTQPGAAATLTLAVAARKGVPDQDEIVTTLYQRLSTRSGFQQTVAHAPTGRVLDTTHPVALAAMPPLDGGSGLSITVLPDAATTPPTAGAPTLDLTCTPTTPGNCTGVYPLVVTLVRPATGGGTTPVPHARFTTYLTYSAMPSTDRLDFAWVVPVGAPVTIHHGVRNATRALGSPSAAATDALAGLTSSLAEHAGVPVTLATSPQTLQSLAATKHGAGAQAVQSLAAMSADQASREFLAQPYVPIDLGALAGAGEGTEIAAQMDRGSVVLQSLGIQTAGAGGTWVANGPVGSDLQTGLSAPGVGAGSLVLPDADLAPASSSGSTHGTSGTWASAFSLSMGHGAPVLAAASDGELAAHFTADPADPVLEANQLLADLAMIHFEEPYTPTPRAVVAVPPAGWTPTHRFDTALLSGLTTNPLVKPVTIGSLFSAFTGPGTALQSRRLATGGTGPVLAPSLARDITAQRLRLTSFDGSVHGTPPVLSHLNQLLLASESDDLPPSTQRGGVDTFAGALDGQLSLVQLATERTITLTARSGLIPVTLVSAAPYTVVGELTLSGGRFVFPHGSSRHVTLNHPTTPRRIPVEARTSGDLPLQVTFRSPDGRLLIAGGRLTVRSTATSLVGVVLTALALLVLLGWWARTWRRGRRRSARSVPPPGA